MQVRNIAKTMVLAASTLASVSAFAWDYDGIYALGGVSYAGVEQAQFSDENFGDDFENGNLESSGNIGWRAGLGAWLTDNFAVEVNYFGIANMNDEISHEDAIGNVVEHELNVKDMYFLDLSGMGRCFFDDNFWGFARMGVAWAMVEREVYREVNEADRDLVSKDDEGGMGFSLGIGAQYDFTPMIGVRVEASTVQALNENDMYAVSGNLVLNFGEIL